MSHEEEIGLKDEDRFRQCTKFQVRVLLLDGRQLALKNFYAMGLLVLIRASAS